MQSELKMIAVVDMQDPDRKSYKLAEQAVVLVWDFEVFTMCKDVLGNTWLVLDTKF